MSRPTKEQGRAAQLPRQAQTLSLLILGSTRLFCLSRGKRPQHRQTPTHSAVAGSTPVSSYLLFAQPHVLLHAPNCSENEYTQLLSQAPHRLEHSRSTRRTLCTTHQLSSSHPNDPHNLRGPADPIRRLQAQRDAHLGLCLPPAFTGPSDTDSRHQDKLRFAF